MYLQTNRHVSLARGWPGRTHVLSHLAKGTPSASGLLQGDISGSPSRSGYKDAQKFKLLLRVRGRAQAVWPPTQLIPRLFLRSSGSCMSAILWPTSLSRREAQQPQAPSLSWMWSPRAFTNGSPLFWGPQMMYRSISPVYKNTRQAGNEFILEENFLLFVLHPLPRTLKADKWGWWRGRINAKPPGCMEKSSNQLPMIESEARGNSVVCVKIKPCS